MPPEQRSSERTRHYTMKTTGRSPKASSPSHTHSRTNSQSLFNMNKTNSPVDSPRMPHSVGQPYPPKLSPGVSRVNPLEVRTPSPNYFGLNVEPIADPRDSAGMPGDKWSPQTSSVKSFGTALPNKQLPLDANPEFEAFKRQVDLNKGRGGFNLSTSHFGGVSGPTSIPTASTPSALQRPRPPRWHTHDSNTSDSPFPKVAKTGSKPTELGTGRNEVDTHSLHDSAYVSGDCKRNSEASLSPPSLLNMGRFESPAHLEAPFAPPERRANAFKIDDRHPRLSAIPSRVDSLAPNVSSKARAATVPSLLESGGPSMMAPEQLNALLENDGEEDVLLLDLRVSPQYADSRIIGSLNFCVPTTLLKRPTFDLQKLQQTFQFEQDREKFARWRKAKHLVVYDAASTEKRDATSGVNMVKKFTTEGYSGSTSILRGGFRAFAATHPALIDRSTGTAAPGLSLTGGSGPTLGRASIAPIIGGVPLPTSNNAANPFFNNIRQNQDLVDGVGQMDIAVPPALNSECLPRWLQQAAEHNNHGKKVADKFLQIELAEQARMKNAYSSFNSQLTEKSSTQPQVQLSGIEKGVKNRYKDILPFEHARVRLQGREEGSCDYVNASHIKASRSHKRYIASQGPLPATFEDFWSMIWDQDIRVLVMLTAESEGGQLKCHPYWKGREFGPVRLRALSEKKVSLDIDKHRSNPTATPDPSSYPSSSGSGASSVSTVRQGSFNWNPQPAEVGRRRANTTTTLDNNTPKSNQPQAAASDIPYVIIRKFALSHAAHPFMPMREITHLHYPSWPDFGAPAQPSHLLALVELANVMQRAALPSEGRQSGHGSCADGRRDSSRSPDQARAGRGSLKKNDGVSLGWHDAPESEEDTRPMLVHCSAGCGRTGTFCTVDSVIDMLKRQRLQASKDANQIIAEREQHIAQQMSEARARASMSPKTDAEGDVRMEYDFDGLSPLTVSNEPPVYPVSTPASQDASEDVTMSEDGASLSGDDDEENIDVSWLSDENIDLITRTVEDFRGQRLSMVQSLRQFVLCYETIIEWTWRLQERGGSIGSTARGKHNRTSSLAL